MFKLYLTNRSVNEATSHYISLIEKAIASAGGFSKRVYSVKEILKDDIIITVESKDFFKLQLLKPNNKKINWFQGINPEEALLDRKNILRMLFWSMYERVTLRKSVLNIFVSKAMEEHYSTKYGHYVHHSFIMPCYNSLLNPSAFYYKNKYTCPSFVYTGSLNTWQCLTKVLEIFKHIQILMPNATLKILTTAQEKAKLLIKQFDLNNCDVDYVPISKIGEELKRYKYGFLIRENQIVNKVSTPTKMNTYLANGVIPIFSDVILAFKEHINLRNYELRLLPELQTKDIAQLIYSFETKVDVEPKIFYNICQNIFENYYNDEIYVERLGEVFKHIISK